MTAMPPTTGHLKLIQFARAIADQGVTVQINTQPHEPLPEERYKALEEATRSMGDVEVRWVNQAMEQAPSAPGFWDMWRNILIFDLGVRPGDFIVASEPYGQELAELTGTCFMPFDMDRTFDVAKGSDVRENPWLHWTHILPEFRKYLGSTVTIFGAESTGKTTLSNKLVMEFDATGVFEYARPYLENAVNVITSHSMYEIWQGQRALQELAQEWDDTGLVIQDTDLFSTVGYWELPAWEEELGGKAPQGLIEDAQRLESDLYIVTRSDIPFEPDPLRYGGDQREGTDDYWVELCKKYGLNYLVLDCEPDARLDMAADIIDDLLDHRRNLIAYDRKGL